MEYYFKGDEKRLTFPWHKGLKAEDMYSYYEEVAYKDFVHKETGAPVLKAQHPEFEFWNQGITARSGVACADCHMSYKREGGQKVIQRPSGARSMLNTTAPARAVIDSPNRR